ncbi:E-selectin-like [Mytilus edulis]|uniref:E-selectin-like n=1 Tax=Mytilus edulis TaxID=6550 RepID=UPI0039F080F8
MCGKKMSFVFNFLVIIFVSVKAKHNPCIFVPNVSTDCIEYLTFNDMKPGCLNTVQLYEFTGLNSTVNGHYFISVRPTDWDSEESIQIWIKRNDGHCTDNCCNEDTQQKRGWGFGFHYNCAPDPCNGHGTCGINTDDSYYCTCQPGYTGHSCGQGE